MADPQHDCAPRADLVQGTRRLRFSEVTTAVDRVAAAFAVARVRAGDRILLLADNSPEWVVSFWAGSRLGAVVALGNAWWSAAEVDHAVRLVSPRLVVCDPARRNLLPPDLPAEQVVEIGAVRVWTEDDVDPPVVPAPGGPLSQIGGVQSLLLAWSPGARSCSSAAASTPSRYSTEFPLQQRFRDVMTYLVADGTAEIQKRIIAKEILAR